MFPFPRCATLPGTLDTHLDTYGISRQRPARPLPYEKHQAELHMTHLITRG
jgi:hypothetical protein